MDRHDPYKENFGFVSDHDSICNYGLICQIGRDVESIDQFAISENKTILVERKENL